MWVNVCLTCWVQNGTFWSHWTVWFLVTCEKAQKNAVKHREVLEDNMVQPAKLWRLSDCSVTKYWFCLGFPLLSGVGYEWEDDFPLHPLATSSELSDSPPPRSVPKPPNPKPAAHFSRFTVSPSSVSRFSITHISDSDMDSVGGGSPKKHLYRVTGHSWS